MIRDIGFLQWKDPLAWMETMKGNSWIRTLQKENLHFQTAVTTESEKDFIDAKEQATLKDVFKMGDIYITPQQTYSYQWRWKDEDTLHTAAAIQCHGDTVWVVEEGSGGKETYTVSCYTKKERVWHSKTYIGPFLCVADSICYVVEETSTLRYGVCVALNAKTGRERNVLYTEPSLRTNLALLRGEGDCVFLRSDNSGRQALYHIEGTSIKRVGEECCSFVPVGYGSTKEPCFFGRVGSFQSPWSAFGHELSEYPIPKAVREHSIVFFSLANSLLITSAGGVRSVYHCHPGRHPEKINKIIGTVCPDTFGKGSTYIAISPGSTPSIYDTKTCTLRGKVYASFTLEKARSKDGTQVPYVLVKQRGRCSGLLVSLYGAYGIPTSLDTTRWRPYLDAGWAVAFALIRGGGDYGDAWADAARVSRKGRSIEDAHCVIQAAQHKTGVHWSKTCLYGRSAGGYTLGSLVAHYGGGGLIGAAYAEVPYVDILRTTTNPGLPLTVLEYEEFGNPAEHLEDLETILRLSPVDALPAEGAPAIFVVARTSLNDMEVLPYESVKWITRLRGYPTPVEGSAEKYLYIQDGEGHFIRGSLEMKQKSEDFSLLNKWLTRV